MRTAEYFEGPIYRRLRGFAFDPSLSGRLDTVMFNHIIFKVRWSDYKSPGPVGDYLEVIDYDPASGFFYPPVNLDNKLFLAQDGIFPTESNPQFHQQMVYAVAMTTIENFERALGRWINWSARDSKYVEKLRIYPHAFRGPNAFYLPEKKAILFGYFPAVADNNGRQLPEGTVFTCLSHDIITHEVTHAILDGFNSNLLKDTNPDILAFHEAFSDIIALFQRFSFPDILKSQIAKTRGDLSTENLLGQLATQFGEAIGKYGSLRDAIGKRNDRTGEWEPKIPDPEEYQYTLEAHDRGAILVAAIFDAFIQVYQSKVADLIRIGSNGTGVLAPGELHPDMINRLSKEASKVAQVILNMCIRALDYCPPVDLNFGDYLRALITADLDLVPEDTYNYRLAIIDGFRKRGIYPEGVKSLSIDSLRWTKYEKESKEGKENIEDDLYNWFTDLRRSQNPFISREQSFILVRRFGEYIPKEGFINLGKLESFEKLTGLVFNKDDATTYGIPYDNTFAIFKISALAFNRRVSPTGKTLNHVVLSITQERQVDKIVFEGGCTIIYDYDSAKVLYVIKKSILDQERKEKQMKYLRSTQVEYSKEYLTSLSLSEYFGFFANLHK